MLSCPLPYPGLPPGLEFDYAIFPGFEISDLRSGLAETDWVLRIWDIYLVFMGAVVLLFGFEMRVGVAVAVVLRIPNHTLHAACIHSHT